MDNLSNISILPHLPHPELLQLYSKYKVYVQASISEGMPNALIEAMTMCCVPIGSNVAGIPEVIASHGLILRHRSVDELEKLLVQALKMDNSVDIRNYIVSKFDFDIRKKRLFWVLDQHLSK
jgi:glycosyltransferase involved in cell wall biosynthesis